MNKKLLFIFIIIAQLVFLSANISYHLHKINAADKILLETEPVDPFSVFRGRYVSLNYKISTLAANLFRDCNPRDLKHNDFVYVALEKKDKFWQPVAAYKNKPKSGASIFLKGRAWYPYSDNIRVNYGIESFFLSEKSADEIENNTRGFGSGNWQEEQELIEKRMQELSEEERRIHKAGITEYWFKSLDKEIDYWLKEELLNHEEAVKIRQKYSQALAKIKSAQHIDRGRQLHPLTVEVAVASDGSGYPVKLFWKGKEYR